MSTLLSGIAQAQRCTSGLRVGLDVVLISHVRSSLLKFGVRFIDRLFSHDEAAYAMSGGDLAAERLAARFAAKEATLKAFELSNAGINWRDIEVVKTTSGGCRLQLHRRAADLVGAMGADEIALSLSHDGDYAAAMVASIGRSQGIPTQVQPL
jgi:holo-[acyl-carrier protein] synthase